MLDARELVNNKNPIMGNVDCLNFMSATDIEESVHMRSKCEEVGELKTLWYCI